MTEAPQTADDALRRIDSDIAAAQARAAQATIYRQETETLRGAAKVNGVTVTVDSSGRLVDVELPRLHEGSSPTALSAAILEASAAAQKDVAQRLAAGARASFGEDSATTKRIEHEIDRHFRTIT